MRTSVVSTDTAYYGNSTTHVRAAAYREAAQCDIIMITAGSRFSSSMKKSHDVSGMQANLSLQARHAFSIHIVHIVISRLSEP